MQDNAIGLNKWELDTPALCLDLRALDRNIARMADFLHDGPTGVRPHSKTHKCPTIAWKQLRAGAVGITCAKVGEAEAMASAGIKDILIANQVIGRAKITRLMGLAADTEIMVAVEALENARGLSDAARQAAAARHRRGGHGHGALRHSSWGRRWTSPVRWPACPGCAWASWAMRAHRDDGYGAPTRRRRGGDGALDRHPGPVAEGWAAGAHVSAGGSGTYISPGATRASPTSAALCHHGCPLSHHHPRVRDRPDGRRTGDQCPGDRAVIDAGLKTMTPEFGKPEVMGRGLGAGPPVGGARTLTRQTASPRPGTKSRSCPHGCTTTTCTTPITSSMGNACGAMADEEGKVQ